MEQQPSSHQPKAKRLKWWQFTLKSLLLLMLLLSVPLAWVGNELASKRRELDLAEAIQKAGGSAVQSEVNRLNIPDPLNVPWKSDDPFDSESWTQAFRITRVVLNGGNPTEFRALLGRLKQLPYLRELDLSYTHVRDADLLELERLDGLTDLDLADSQVGDAGIEHVLRSPDLRKLALEFTHISDAGLEKLAGLRSLQEVDVTGTQVTGHGIAKLQNERPDLQVTREGHLSSRREVIAARGLRLHGWHVGFWEDVPDGPIGVTTGERQQLSKLEVDCLMCLKRLNLTISMGAPSSINALLPELAGLESLESYNVLNDDELRSLIRCRNLKCLVLWQTMFSEDGWATFQEFPRLETLGLTPAPRDIEEIAKAKNLTSLVLHSGTFRGQDLAPLLRLPRLTDLHLMHAQFDPGATQPLGDLENLESLNLEFSNLDDASLLPLLQLKKLVNLHVDNTRISDEGLLRLAEIKSLKTLTSAWSQNVTDDGRKRFRKLRPDVTSAP